MKFNVSCSTAKTGIFASNGTRTGGMDNFWYMIELGCQDVLNQERREQTKLKLKLPDIIQLIA